MAEKDIYTKVVEGILKASEGKPVLVEYQGLELIIVKGKYYPFVNEFEILEEAQSPKEDLIDLGEGGQIQ